MTIIGYHQQRLDLVVHTGDPIDVSIPVLDALGVIVPLAGWTASAKAYQYIGGPALYDFLPTISADRIHVATTSAQTGAWSWPVFAARLLVTATPPAGAPIPITHGWVRFYQS